MTEFHSLEPPALEAFLERRRATPAFGRDMSLAENLVAILRKANEFVPSEGGSILLDNPKAKSSLRSENALTFIATFGGASEGLLGREISAEDGIAGHVYREGASYTASDPGGDELFYPIFDEDNHYQTRSLVAIPIRIEQEVCGVLELVNRRRTRAYSQQDVNLLEIFAGYISISIENVLDGRQAQEIAKRDNLTGLFNDRSLHIALSRAIAKCRREDTDLALLFLDLDFFKRVNDTHGHLAGSQVLQEVGRILRGAAEGTGAIAARYGGDEFVVLLPGCDLRQGIDVAEALREEVVGTTFCSARGEIQPEPLYLTGITCSLGIAALHRHVTEELPIEQCKGVLLRLADTAMYVAKETGRNRTATAAEPVRPRVAASLRPEA